MQIGAMTPQPRACGARILAQYFRMSSMKGGAMVHMHEMRHFMRDGGAADFGRGEDEPPAIAQRPG